MILALDLSTTSTGYCIGKAGADKPKTIGTITPDRRWALEKRIAFIVGEILILMRSEAIGAVYCEALFYMRGAQAVRAIFMLHGAVAYELFNLAKPCFYINQMSAKKSLGLKGNCKKFEVFNEIVARGIKVKNEDESDAVAVFLNIKE